MGIYDGRPSRVSVIITSHNYGHFLKEAIESVLSQTRKVDEIVVVDDASDYSDTARDVVESFAADGIRYICTDHGTAWLARKEGFKATTGDIVCFLDADDCLDETYIDEGIAAFNNNYRVGIVYTDIQHFGDSDNHRVFRDDYDSVEIDRYNWIHSGSLVRRIALDVSRAFEDVQPTLHTHEDWLLWQRVLRAGWKAVKSPSLYFYRQHPAGKTKQVPLEQKYRVSTVETAEVTIVTAFSGREWAIWDYEQWLYGLYEQSFDLSRLRLLFVDASGCESFRVDLEGIFAGFVQAQYFPDVRLVRFPGGIVGLADAPRKVCADAVRLACAQIYNWVAREVSTPFILTVEDDILPPLDVIPKLLEHFTPRVMAVAAPYRSRFYDGYVQAQIDPTTFAVQPIREKLTGVTKASSLGFGCTMFRREMFAKSVVTAGSAVSVAAGDVLPDFDTAFFARWSGWDRLINWDVEAEHRHGPTA